MKEVKTILRELTDIPASGPEAPADSGSLLRCDRCGGALQKHLTLWDRTMTVPCLCSCRLAERDNRFLELQRQEEQDRIQRIRSAAMQDAALLKCTFDASEHDSTGLRAAGKYVEQWPRMLASGTGLLFWGSVGTGKTYIAACIANALTARKIPVLMTSFSRILGSLPGPASGEQTAFIDDLMRYQLLILDDLGVERETPYAMELVYRIIDSRCRSGKPMIITTNLTMEELENPDSREKMRIYDRVLERCIPVRVEGQHIRGRKRKENLSLARKQLA